MKRHAKLPEPQEKCPKRTANPKHHVADEFEAMLNEMEQQGTPGMKTYTDFSVLKSGTTVDIMGRWMGSRILKYTHQDSKRQCKRGVVVLQDVKGSKVRLNMWNQHAALLESLDKSIKTAGTIVWIHAVTLTRVSQHHVRVLTHKLNCSQQATLSLSNRSQITIALLGSTLKFTG
jgi:hypothetical protein